MLCYVFITVLSPRAHLHVVGMLRFISDINQPSFPIPFIPFYSVLVSVSVFMALSTVFHSINSPDNSPFSPSVLPVLSLPYWSCQQLYISLWKSPSALIKSIVVDGAQKTNQLTNQLTLPSLLVIKGALFSVLCTLSMQAQCHHWVPSSPFKRPSDVLFCFFYYYFFFKMTWIAFVNGSPR